jgi:hypothetical protein
MGLAAPLMTILLDSAFPTLTPPSTAPILPPVPIRSVRWAVGQLIRVWRDRTSRIRAWSGVAVVIGGGVDALAWEEDGAIPRSVTGGERQPHSQNRG